MANELKIVKRDVKNREEVISELKRLEKAYQGAWIACIPAFSGGKGTEFIQYLNRASIPDCYLDFAFEKTVCYHGKLTTFTDGAIKRESMRGLFSGDR